MENILTRTAARVPLQLTVGVTSQMILPPTLDQIDLSTIDEWEPTTAYVYGDFIRAGEGADANFYWCVAAGNSGAVMPTHADGDAVDGTTTWRKMHYGRDVVSLTNVDGGNISIARGAAAVALHGIVLYQNGSQNEGYDEMKPYNGAWYAIADAPRLLAISEG